MIYERKDFLQRNSYSTKIHVISTNIWVLSNSSKKINTSIFINLLNICLKHTLQHVCIEVCDI
jgi:hypothetical protein